MSIFFNDWVFIPIFSLCVGFFVFIWSDKVYTFLKQKTFGRKEQIIKYMRLSGQEVNERRLNLMLVALSWGLGLLFFLLFYPNIIVGLLFGATMTAVGMYLPFTLMKARYDRRCTEFNDQLVDGLTLMANQIKSGANLTKAMESVISIMSGPINDEFTVVLNQHRLGQSIEDALTEMAERIPRQDVQMLVTSIVILKETGGNLSETFETITEVIRGRQKMEKKIEALTAQGMMQGLIVTMVPFVLAIVFYIIDPNYIKPMFTTTLGLVLVFVMLAMQVIGGVFIRKVVTIKV